MSYCRWSSDNFRCDLYCYEDVSGGYTTHVAGRRRLGLDTLPPSPYDDEAFELIRQKKNDEWEARYKAYDKALNALEFEDITLPHAGLTFNDPDLETFKMRLLSLRSLGYRFPDYVLEEVDEEIAAERSRS